MDDIWNKLKGKGNDHKALETVHTVQTPIAQEISEASEQIKIITKENKLDDEIQKAITKSKEATNKIMIETVEFAGKKYEYKKQNLTEDDLKAMKDKEKKATHKGLDSIIDSISKKNNLNTLGKSKKDWQAYVEEKQIDKVLDFNRKDG